MPLHIVHKYLYMHIYYFASILASLSYSQLSFLNTFTFIYVLSVCLCLLHKCSYPQRPEESVRSLRVRVTGDCEPPNVSVENLTQGLWMSWMSVSFLFVCLVVAVFFFLINLTQTRALWEANSLACTQFCGALFGLKIDVGGTSSPWAELSLSS